MTMRVIPYLYMYLPHHRLRRCGEQCNGSSTTALFLYFRIPKLQDTMSSAEVQSPGVKNADTDTDKESVETRRAAALEIQKQQRDAETTHRIQKDAETQTHGVFAQGLFSKDHGSEAPSHTASVHNTTANTSIQTRGKPAYKNGTLEKNSEYKRCGAQRECEDALGLDAYHANLTREYEKRTGRVWVRRECGWDGGVGGEWGIGEAWELWGDDDDDGEGSDWSEDEGEGSE